MTQPSQPAGWYPDPSGAPGQRYWDGRQWGIGARPQQSKTRWWPGLAVAGAIFAVAGLGYVVSSRTPEMKSDADTAYAIGADSDWPAGVWETQGSNRDNGRDCTWSRLRRPEVTINATIRAGRVGPGEVQRVTLNPGEWFHTVGCHPWRLVG